MRSSGHWDAVILWTFDLGWCRAQAASGSTATLQLFFAVEGVTMTHKDGPNILPTEALLEFVQLSHLVFMFLR